MSIFNLDESYYKDEISQLNLKIEQLQSKIGNLHSKVGKSKENMEEYSMKYADLIENMEKCTRHIKNLKVDINAANKDKDYWGNVKSLLFQQVVDQSQMVFDSCMKTNRT